MAGRGADRCSCRPAMRHAVVARHGRVLRSSCRRGMLSRSASRRGTTALPDSRLCRARRNGTMLRTRAAAGGSEASRTRSVTISADAEDVRSCEARLPSRACLRNGKRGVTMLLTMVAFGNTPLQVARGKSAVGRSWLTAPLATAPHRGADGGAVPGAAHRPRTHPRVALACLGCQAEATAQTCHESR